MKPALLTLSLVIVRFATRRADRGPRRIVSGKQRRSIGCCDINFSESLSEVRAPDKRDTSRQPRAMERGKQITVVSSILTIYYIYSTLKNTVRSPMSDFVLIPTDMLQSLLPMHLNLGLPDYPRTS